MTGSCITGLLHTLDMVERPFYIPRTPQSHLIRPVQPGTVPASKAGDLSPVFFPRLCARFLHAVQSVHPLQQEVLAKRDSYVSVAGQSPDRAAPASHLGRPVEGPARRGTHLAFAPVRIGNKPSAVPLRAAGTQEDEE